MQTLAELLSRVSYTPKLAFALHTAEVYTHFRAILNCLSPQDYDLILIHPDDELRALVADLPCAVYELPQLLQSISESTDQLRGRGYRYLVSHHYHGMMKLHLSENPEDSVYYPLIKFLGQYNIRLMYGLGHDHWNLAEWNRYYDLHLCFGPWQVERLAAFPESIKLEVGVPRYSDYFTQAQDPALRSALRQRHGLKAEDRVLVWLPTLGPENTLPIYLPLIQALMHNTQQNGEDEFCLRIKPHPLSWHQEPDKLKGLADLPPEWVIKTPCDNLELFLIADYILCDYGGVAFSAVYTDQNLLLLDHPDKVLAEAESDALMRQTLPALSPQHSDELRAILNNPHHWQAQAAQRAALRKRFFTPYKAQSAKMAAKILSNLADYLP